MTFLNIEKYDEQAKSITFILFDLKTNIQTVFPKKKRFGKLWEKHVFGISDKYRHA